MAMTVDIAALLYLVASICFVLALRGLSHPESSRAGNLYGMVGMLIAIVTTLLDLNHRFAGALTQTVSEVAPDAGDSQQLAMGLMLAFDANLVLSLFEPRQQRSEERRAAVQAYADLIVGSLRPKG